MSNYICPFCHKDCGPDYSDHSDHVQDEHADTASCEERR